MSPYGRQNGHEHTFEETVIVSGETIIQVKECTGEKRVMEYDEETEEDCGRQERVIYKCEKVENTETNADDTEEKTHMETVESLKGGGTSMQDISLEKYNIGSVEFDTTSEIKLKDVNIDGGVTVVYTHDSTSVPER